jgi:hypothetical protein
MGRTLNHWVLAIATVLCLAAPTSSFAQTPPATTSDFKTDAPDVVKHQLLGRLESIISEDSTSIRNRRIGASGAVFYWVRPRHGMTPGMCVSDRIEIGLDKLNDPSRIVGVGSELMYHFITPPPQAYPSFGYAGSAEADTACAALHPESDDTFLRARNEETATTGAWVFNAAEVDSKAGHPSLVTHCPYRSAAECKNRFGELGLQQIKLIGDCFGNYSHRPGDTCWLFGFADGDWQIVVDHDLVPQQISEAPPIVVTSD